MRQAHGPTLRNWRARAGDFAFNPTFTLHIHNAQHKTIWLVSRTRRSSSYTIARHVLMTDSTPDAPAPKKRSLFKRSAWQDAPKTEGEDMFSHASQFKDIVAEQTKTQAEKRAKLDAAKRQRRAAGPADRKRRKTSSSDHEEMAVLNSSPICPDRANSKAYVAPFPLRLSPCSMILIVVVDAAERPSLHTLRPRRHTDSREPSRSSLILGTRTTKMLIRPP